MRKAARQVKQQVAAIETMSLKEVRNEWQRRYGVPPRHRAVFLLRRVLAWRIQADVLGALDASTRRMLEHEGCEPKPSALPGTRLAREYAGRRHEVTVLDDGVVYEGQTFGSLSEVARHITGQRWNGPRFFGLRQENRR